MDHFSMFLRFLLILEFLRGVNMSSKKEGRLSPNDPYSYARPDIAKVVNISLNLDVNFDKEILEGFVVLTVRKVDRAATEVILDSRYLVIDSVTDEASGKPLDFHVSEEGYVGSKLVIQLPKSDAEEVKIKIAYQTTGQSTALQWLDKNQTASKSHPYLFSQCESIHCRSMVPCQDTPSVKSPYSAEISAPADMTVLMSAVGQGEPSKGADGKKVYRFHQKIPIQPYLIAIAVGKLESRKIGPRTHIWSEKEYVDKAAFDFSETETMLLEAEELCGPYIWGVYDILVLPPSFPYGGMENPCLTFATPTLLTGDKSLANVIAHEIAHSWSGNLVTSKNFEHFWLNEGFTRFMEDKIMGRMFGDNVRHLSGIGGWKKLKDSIETLGESNPVTALVLNLEDVQPDDAFSIVPYEKGAVFLWYLEELVGGSAVFEPFLKKYYDHFKYQSIDSYDFKKFFLDNFKDNSNISKIDWNTWFKAPGMPKYKPEYDQSLALASTDLRKRWVLWDESKEYNFESSDLKNFSADQITEFLVQLSDEEPLSATKMAKLEELYHFNNNNNYEIKSSWIKLALKAEWENIIPKAIEMVTEQGRMKYLKAIYRGMYAWDKTKELAVSTFIKNKPSMMHVTIHAIEKVLKLKTQ